MAHTRGPDRARPAAPAAPPRWPARLRRWRWPMLAVWLLAVALLTRASVLGDWAYFNDEAFYLLVARQMHRGAWLYADVWDRKGPGLFATYWLATSLSESLVAVRVLALACAAATALVLAAIARRRAGAIGAGLAATLYLAMLPMFVGAGAQPQVFQNLLVALAALLTVQSAERGRPARLVLAMLLVGAALTFKQTAICEGLAFGLWGLWRHWRAGAGPGQSLALAAVMALAGMAPFALAGLTFALGGHFAALWQAMVTANLVKTYDPYGDHWQRLHALAIAASPALVLAAAGLVPGANRGAAPGAARAAMPRAGAGFALVWLAGAAGGLALIPNFYADYMLPLLPPLAIAAAPALGRRPGGPPAAVAAILIYLATTSALEFADRRAASAEVAALARAIATRRPHPRLLVYEGPLALYALTDAQTPPSPLLDNFHLSFPYENNTSSRDTGAEMAKILRWRPQVVVLARPGATRENPRTGGQVRGYVAHCRLSGHATYHEIAATLPLDVFACPV